MPRCAPASARASSRQLLVCRCGSRTDLRRDRPPRRYAAGVYNLFNGQYALPAVPYAANRMPQNGRSLILSLTATRGAECPTV
jgi:hypothetical protein